MQKCKYLIFTKLLDTVEVNNDPKDKTNLAEKLSENDFDAFSVCTMLENHREGMHYLRIVESLELGQSGIKTFFNSVAHSDINEMAEILDAYKSLGAANIKRLVEISKDDDGYSDIHSLVLITDLSMMNYIKGPITNGQAVDFVIETLKSRGLKGAGIFKDYESFTRRLGSMLRDHNHDDNYIIVSGEGLFSRDMELSIIREYMNAVSERDRLSDYIR